MTIAINVAPEVEAKLEKKAAALGMDLPKYLEAVVEREAVAATAPNEVEPSELDRAVAEMTSRTPEQIAAMRERLLAASPPPRPLPPGKTLFDVIGGQWPGDETDEQIKAALDDLS